MMNMNFVEVRVNLNEEDNANRMFQMVKVVSKGMRGFVLIEDRNYVGVVIAPDESIETASNLAYEFRKTFFLNDVSLVATLKDHRQVRIM